MTPTLEVTVKMQIEATSDDISLIASLPSKLANRLDDLTALVPDAIQIVSVQATGMTQNSNTIALQRQLASQLNIAVVWGVEQVIALRPDLTKDQAWQVLLVAQATHRGEFGINYDVLETIAEQIYGAKPSFGDSLAA